MNFPGTNPFIGTSVVTADGHVIAAGSDTREILIRTTLAGNVDPTFGTNGIATDTVTTGNNPQLAVVSPVRLVALRQIFIASTGTFSFELTQYWH